MSIQHFTGCLLFIVALSYDGERINTATRFYFCVNLWMRHLLCHVQTWSLVKWALCILRSKSCRHLVFHNLHPSPSLPHTLPVSPYPQLIGASSRLSCEQQPHHTHLAISHQPAFDAGKQLTSLCRMDASGRWRHCIAFGFITPLVYITVSSVVYQLSPLSTGPGSLLMALEHSSTPSVDVLLIGCVD